MSKEKNRSKLIARASILNDVSAASLEKIQAAQCNLETRGKFPVGLVSQPDVLALQAVILTTGRPGNLNDDVMLNSEVLPILWTAALKPFNVEHSKHVIGVMFDAFAIDRTTGDVIQGVERFNEEETDEDRKDEQQELQSVIGKFPEQLDIITNQILWAEHFKAEVMDIKKKAIAGEIFVSMEVWFADHDYLIGNRIVKRTPELSALLEEKLRINGGSGRVGLDTIKRVPRNLVFAGNAAVETPANPDSFILDVMDRGDLMDSQAIEHIEEEAEASENIDERIEQMVAENTLCILESLSDESETNQDANDALEAGRSGNLQGSEACGSALGNAEVGEVVNQELHIMESNEKLVDMLEEKNGLLQSDFEAKVAELADASKEQEELQAKTAELEAKLEETLALLAEKEEALAEKAEAFVKLEAAKVELDTKLEETSAKLAEIEEARKLETRQAALGELGLSEERIVRILAKTDELDDEAFDAELEDIKAFMSELTPVPTILETLEPETVKVEEPVAEEVAEVEEEEEEEASEEEIAEVLEETEEEEAPVAEAIDTVEVEVENETEQVIHSALAKALGVNL